MLEENVDFELVPVDGVNEMGWEIRIMTGDFVETVIRYGQLKYDQDDDSIHFDFFLTSSPDPEVNESNKELQQRAAQILESILETAAEEGNLISSTPNDS